MDGSLAPGMAALHGSSPAVAVLRKLVDLRRFGGDSSLASKEAALRQAIMEYYRQRSAATSIYQNDSDAVAVQDTALEVLQVWGFSPLFELVQGGGEAAAPAAAAGGSPTAADAAAGAAVAAAAAGAGPAPTSSATGGTSSASSSSSGGSGLMSMRLYTSLSSVVNMVRQTSGGNPPLRRWHSEALAGFLTHTILPAVAHRHGIDQLQEFGRRWAQYKLAAEWMRCLFRGLDDQQARREQQILSPTAAPAAASAARSGPAAARGSGLTAAAAPLIASPLSAAAAAASAPGRDGAAPTLMSTAMRLFRSLVFDACAPAFGATLRGLLARDRAGERQNRELIAGILQLYVVMGICTANTEIADVAALSRLLGSDAEGGGGAAALPPDNPYVAAFERDYLADSRAWFEQLGAQFASLGSGGVFDPSMLGFGGSGAGEADGAEDGSGSASAELLRLTSPLASGGSSSTGGSGSGVGGGLGGSGGGGRVATLGPLGLLALERLIRHEEALLRLMPQCTHAPLWSTLDSCAIAPHVDDYLGIAGESSSGATRSNAGGSGSGGGSDAAAAAAAVMAAEGGLAALLRRESDAHADIERMHRLLCRIPTAPPKFARILAAHVRAGTDKLWADRLARLNDKIAAAAATGAAAGAGGGTGGSGAGGGSAAPARVLKFEAEDPSFTIPLVDTYHRYSGLVARQLHRDRDCQRALREVLEGAVNRPVPDALLSVHPSIPGVLDLLVAYLDQIMMGRRSSGAGSRGGSSNSSGGGAGGSGGDGGKAAGAAAASTVASSGAAAGSTPAAAGAAASGGRGRGGASGGGGVERLSAEEMEAEWRRALELFDFAQEKDRFMTAYHHALARRLLGDKSESLDAEKAALSVLKTKQGAAFTALPERMLHNIASGQQWGAQYAAVEAHMRALNAAAAGAAGRPAAVDAAGAAVAGPLEPVPHIPGFSVRVLEYGAWPAFGQIQPPTLPRMIQEHINAFTTSYRSLVANDKRQLRWIWTQGTAEIAYHVSPMRVLTGVSTLTMLALLQLNTASEAVSVADMAEAVGLGSDLVNARRLFAPLCCDPVKRRAQVLRISGKPVTDRMPRLADDDVLEINPAFGTMTPMLRLAVARVDLDAVPRERLDAEVESLRVLQVEAAAVRVAKARKVIRHNELVGEVMEQLSTFRPKPSLIKKVIETLIERDYLERDDADASTYRYLA